MSEVGTGKINLKAMNGATSYQHSFGALPNEYAYVNAWAGGSGYDERPQLKAMLDAVLSNVPEMKSWATTSFGAGTAGQALIPVYVDPRVVDTTRKYTPWVELISRVTNMGITADWNEVTSKDRGVTRAEYGVVPKGNDSGSRKTEPIKYLYSKGQVSGPAQAAQPAYLLEAFRAQGSGLVGSNFANEAAPNAKQMKVILRARALREKEEDLVWNGDKTTDATQFSGIVKQQGTTNQVDKASTAIEYDDTETAIDLAFADSGRPNIAGCPHPVLRDLRKIMIDLFRYSPKDLVGQLPFGVSSQLVLETTVGPVPVIPSQFLTSDANEKALYFLDMDYIEMRVLQDMTYEDKPDEDDSQVFLLKMYEALILRAPQFNAFVDNIA